MATLKPEGTESSSCYVLMEDDDKMRRMTMPQQNSGCASGLGTRNCSVSISSPSHASSEGSEDALTELPDFSQRPSRLRPQLAAAKPGILRLSGSYANGSVEGSAPARRPKKQVSIALPEPPGYVGASHGAGSGDSVGDDGAGDNGGVTVQVDVHDSMGESAEGWNTHTSAAELLNGSPPQDPEEPDEPMESDWVLLRNKPDGWNRKRDSKRRSLRHSLTSSLNRIRIRKKLPKLQRLQSTLDRDELAQNELELKASLYWHIGTPIKRWKVDGQVPIKLILQLLKTFCLIVQVIVFTQTIPHKRAEFFFDSRIVFESLFIVNFTPETVLKTQTVYSIQQFSDELEFIAANYYQLPNITIGGYDYVQDSSGAPVPLELHLRQYRQADLYASERRFVLDGEVEEIEFNFSRDSLYDSITEQLFEESQDPLFHKFIDLRLKIPINIIRIEAPQKAECYRFTVEIVFENDDHNGKILYYLKSRYRRLGCDGDILTDQTSYNVVMGAVVVLDIIVFGFCVVSLFLTAKTLLRAYRLGKAMGQFYHRELHLPLTWWERRSLFSPWHYFNIISDLLISVGTIYKLLLQFEVLLHASPARILLGSALLFQAGVILRYINYFKQINALTRTLALAFPNLLKFLLCGAVLFFAFALCGWIVLGPFHPKFTDFICTVETLFSLLNGDDIYNTYIQIDAQVDLLAYIYSRFFLYTFLFLFIYTVLNLFTSLIISAYEISQNKDTAMGNEVRRFVFSGPLTPQGVALRDVTSTSKYVDPSVILNKAQKKNKSTESSDDDQ